RESPGFWISCAPPNQAREPPSRRRTSDKIATTSATFLSRLLPLAPAPFLDFAPSGLETPLNLARFAYSCSAQTNILRSARRAAAKRSIDLRERSLLRLLGFLPSLSSRRLRDFIALASR
ncbi:MAG: hypothetical protein IJ991_06000, partial [Thermoguttaceae bacterium]|nr:hypothetical protein [Thermoguttaceae bacterium]